MVRAAVVLGIVSIAGPAVAGELAWSAPAECPAADKVRADAERLSGHRLEEAPIAARAAAWRDAGGTWRLDLEIAGAEGQVRARRVAGASCAEVAEAAALIVAMALEARAATPLPAPVPASTPPPISRARAPAPPSDETASSVRWSTAAVTGIDATALPRPAYGLGIAGALEMGANRVELRATAWLPRSVLVSPAPVIDVMLLAGAARYCRRLVAFAGSMGEVGACAGLELGVLRAASADPLWTKVGLAWWAAPEVGLAAAFRPVRWMALAIEADGLVPLAREQFVFGAVEVHRAGPIDGRALLVARLSGR